MPFFGNRFVPGLRDIKERRLHLPPDQGAGSLLARTVGDPIARDHADAHGDELLWLATLIRT